jgi:hypothetical protein
MTPRPVLCVTDGKVYESASAAARAYRVAPAAVIALCLGLARRRTVSGRVFRYVEA